jgi:hypothetical protein
VVDLLAHAFVRPKGDTFRLMTMLGILSLSMAGEPPTTRKRARLPEGGRITDSSASV